MGTAPSEDWEIHRIFNVASQSVGSSRKGTLTRGCAGSMAEHCWAGPQFRRPRAPTLIKALLKELIGRRFCGPDGDRRQLADSRQPKCQPAPTGFELD